MFKIQTYPLLFLVLTIQLLLAGCGKNNIRNCEEVEAAACGEVAGKTSIRVENLSKYDFCNLEIGPCCEMVPQGILLAGEQSCYRAYDSAYAITSVKFAVGDHDFLATPFDHVGETVMEIGRYTLKIDVTDLETEKFSFEYVRD